jgi:hypothetical protein
MGVEVRVHRVRRRRNDPPLPDIPRPPNLRNWVIYSALAGVVTILMFEGYLRHKPQYPLPTLSEVAGVSSVITSSSDSLQIVLSWDLTLSTAEGRPDSVRIAIGTASRKDSLIATRRANRYSDTAYVPSPAPGETLTGTSCVAAQHPDRPLAESCTPWQYVRPTPAALASAAAARTIVLRPEGLQVDLDVGGRCSAWQRGHPGRSVWIAVNRAAVPECTGSNGKPTVAQFCAFMELHDGRKIKAANSEKSSYCDELFVEWTRGRYS